MTTYFQTHVNAQPAVSGTDAPVTEYDSTNAGVEAFAKTFDLARAESMELQNDPRFFSSNVIDKRLAAFGKLSIVAGLMMGTSMGQLFSLKKDMDFSKYNKLYGCIGWWQFSGFILQMVVAFMCLISLYTICHQMFYTYRLMTAGPTGFELASMFYLTKSIVMWRHFAIKCLLNGLALFVLSSGITLFVKFIKDAGAGHAKVIVLNVEKGWSMDGEIASGANIGTHLDIRVHTALAYFVLVCFLSCACLLRQIRLHHLSAFREYYSSARAATQPLQQTLLQMAHRNRMATLDT